MQARFRRPAAAAWIALATALGAVPAAQAGPFTPAEDAQVVEHLPHAVGADARAARDARRALREQLRREPASLALALRAARAALDQARRDGDPRELGQAQAALAPWWQLDEPPAPVRLLRATVRQGQHDFEAALADLDALLRPPVAAAPPVALGLQAQAELTRSAILRVQGRHGEAGEACERLASARYDALGATPRLVAQACVADLQGLAGQPQAQATLARLAREPAAAPVRGWLAVLQAEGADRLGDPAAEALYRVALQAEPDVYTLAAYADWLLDQGRAAEVEPLLAGRTEADALLLRQAIAWQRSGDGRAAAAATVLRARFRAAALRHDRTHQREQAMFALHVEGDARAALALAQANWRVQKEPADARVLMAAARAAGDDETRRGIERFQRATGLSDARLRAAVPPAAAARIEP